MPWTDVDPLAVADGRPWREFPWYLGQRHYSGMYWSATEAKLVGYESLLELSRLLMADFDRSSKRIVSQPFQIKAGIEGEQLTRIPDYLVLSEDCWTGAAEQPTGASGSARSAGLLVGSEGSADSTEVRAEETAFVLLALPPSSSCHPARTVRSSDSRHGTSPT
jgi:hypothetical protein